MKKVITILITFALILALAPAALAATTEIRLADVGDLPSFRIHALPAQTVEAGPLRLTVNDVRVGAYTNTARFYAPGFDARPGQTVTTVVVNVTVEGIEGVFSFDPRAALFTASSGETTNCLFYSTKQFSTIVGPGLENAETGALFYVLNDTAPEELTAFDLAFLPPFTDETDLAEPFTLHFVIEGEKKHARQAAGREIYPGAENENSRRLSPRQHGKAGRIQPGQSAEDDPRLRGKK